MFGYWKMAVVGAAALVAGAVWSQDAAAQSSRWAFDPARGGGAAFTCGRGPQGEICATVTCGRQVSGYAIAIYGWSPRGGGGDVRNGRFAIDGEGREAVYRRENDPFVGEIWRLETRGLGRAIVDRLKRGARLQIQPGPRSGVFSFTLAGSWGALSELERRCVSIEGQPGQGRGADRSPFGPRWEQLAAARVNRAVDEDNFELGRNAGRFEALRFVALGNDIRMRQVVVRYGNGQLDRLPVDRRLRAGEETGPIDLRGSRGRFIDRITVVYDTIGSGPRARFLVFGRRAN